MIRANYSDKSIVVDILTKAFDENKGVNYVIKQDHKRVKRLAKLMEYSFNICMLFGAIYLSNDKKACALILFPDKKKTTFKSVLLNLKLIVQCMHFCNVINVAKREKQRENIRPQSMIYYLWYIAVDPSYQKKGIGSAFMKELIQSSLNTQRSIYLETSIEKNIAWYTKQGFILYAERILNCKFYFMKRDLK